MAEAHVSSCQLARKLHVKCLDMLKQVKLAGINRINHLYNSKRYNLERAVWYGKLKKIPFH